METINIPVTVVVEFKAEDRARMDRFNVLMGEYLKRTEPLEIKLESPLAALAQTTQEPATAPEPAAPEKVSPAPAEPEQTAPAAAEEVVEAVTKEELQAMVQELAAPGTGKRDAVKAIVQAYAKKVSDIPEDKRAEVMQKLLDLKEGRA